MDSTNYAAGFFSFQNADINVANLSFAVLSGPQDEKGKVTLKATNNQLQIYASSGGAQPFSAYFGTPNYYYEPPNSATVSVLPVRLQSLTITGDSAVTIDNVTTYTKELNLDSTGAIYLPKTFLGTDGTINVTQSNDTDSIMKIEGTNTTITLGTHRLTASNKAPDGFYDIKAGGSSSIDHSNTYSSLMLDGDIVINSSYDGTDSGQLVVDGFSNQAHKPSILDMSIPQTKLTIFFDSKGNVAQPNTSLTLLSATNDAEISMPEIVDFQPLNSNVTTTWSGAYDEDTKTYKSSGTTITPPTPPSTPGNVVSVINFLTTPAVTTQNSDSTTTASFSDAQLSALAATGSVATITDFIRNATALVVQAMRAADANKEASDESNRAVMNRASSLGGFSANDILTQADGLGTSAGDNEAKHGVWMNGFVEQSIQKKMDDIAKAL